MTFTATLTEGNSQIKVWIGETGAYPWRSAAGAVIYQWQQSSGGVDGWTILSAERSDSITYTNYIGSYLRPVAFSNQGNLLDIAVIRVYSESGNTRISIEMGNNVITIWNYAFNACTNLTSISMPAVTTISNNAFQYNENLANVSMPLVTSIGDSAFYNCSGLTSVSMPNVTSIGNDVFGNCNNLTTFTIGEYFDNLSYLFIGSLTTINVTSNSTTLFKDTNGFVYKKLPNYNASVIFCPRNNTITNLTLTTVTDGSTAYTITEIGRLALCYLVNLTHISMPNVTTIGIAAFQGLTSLVTVSMPALTSLGAVAFNGCNQVTSITIGNYFEGISDLFITNEITIHVANTSTNLFNDNNGLLYKKMPNSKARVLFCPRALAIPLTLHTVSNGQTTYTITEIGNSAFAWCSYLTSVSMPAVTTLGNGAFGGSSITSVSMPAVTTLDNGAFGGCSYLTSVSMPAVTTLGQSAFESCSITSAYMPVVETIGQGAFNSCTSLVNVMIGSSLTSIGPITFVGCHNLRHVYFLGNMPENMLIPGVDDNGNPRNSNEYLFYGNNRVDGVNDITVFYKDGTTGWTTIPENSFVSTSDADNNRIYDVKFRRIPKIINATSSSISGSCDEVLTSVEIPVYVSTNGNTWTTYTANRARSFVWSLTPSSSSYYVSTIYNFYDATYSDYCKTTIVAQPQGNPCFLAGTPVLTNHGYVPIEQIDIDNHTVRNQPIVAITKTVSDETHLIRISKHALGNNYPSKTTLISQNHQVMFMGHMIKAKDLVGLVDNVTRVPYHGEPLYNVLLETHAKMQVNNLIVETLHPEHKIAQLYKLLNLVKPEEREQMIALYNHLERKHKQSITK